MSAGNRKSASERREDVYRAVFRVIGQRGVSGLTTAVLAEEVGVTNGALFRHFPSRDAMLEGAVEHALEKIGETFPAEDLPPLDRILGLAQNRVRLFGSEPGLAWLVRSEEAYLAMPAAAAARLRAVVTRSAGYLLRAVREGMLDGTIRNDVVPESLLVVIMGTIHALLGQRGVHGRGERAVKRDTNGVLEVLRRLLTPDGAVTETE